MTRVSKRVLVAASVAVSVASTTTAVCCSSPQGTRAWRALLLCCCCCCSVETRDHRQGVEAVPLHGRLTADTPSSHSVEQCTVMLGVNENKRML